MFVLKALLMNGIDRKHLNVDMLPALEIKCLVSNNLTKNKNVLDY